MCKIHVTVCGQCVEPTENEEYGCPASNCELILCSTCSNPEVHFDADGNCPKWWGDGLTKQEVESRMNKVAT